MSNPISAVGSFGPPQAGVKRPSLGNPTQVPNGLPAFRGKRVQPGGEIKTPELKVSNRQNRGSNITIPNSRICPLEFLTRWGGRLSPGDVAFVQRLPVGWAGVKALSEQKNTATLNPNDSRNAGHSGQSVNRMIGIDGLNRLLHGSTNPHGWVEGLNVFRAENAGDVVRVGNRRDDMHESDPRIDNNKNAETEVLDEILEHAEQAATLLSQWEARQAAWISSGGSSSTFALSNPKPSAGAIPKYQPEPNKERHGTFRISLLNDFVLDGVVISNDEPGSFTSSGSRDAAIFNIAVQGPAMVNNGYLLYDAGKASVGQEGGRGVEAGPRGSAEIERHQRNMLHGAVGSKGGAPWLPSGMYDFVAAFTGAYSQYPLQSFDRQVKPMNTVHVGIRAYLLDISHEKIKQFDDPSKNVDPLTGADSFWFFQLMPFSSNKAYLIQKMDDALAMPSGTARDREERERAIRSIAHDTAGPASKNLEKRGFDREPYDAIRSVDLHNMVGAWKVGRVMDIKARKYSAYDGGPADTGFALNVDVQVQFEPALRMRSEGGVGWSGLVQGTTSTVETGTGYSDDELKRSEMVTYDRFEMHAIAQPRHPSFVVAAEQRALEHFRRRSSKDPPAQSHITHVPNTEDTHFSFDSSMGVPRKRLRRVEAQNERPCLQQTLGSSVGKRWKPLRANVLEVAEDLGGVEGVVGTRNLLVDEIVTKYMRISTGDSSIVWKKLIELLPDAFFDNTSLKAKTEKRFNDVVVCSGTRKINRLSMALASGDEATKRIVRLLRLPAESTSNFWPMLEQLLNRIDAKPNDGEITKDEFDAYFAVNVAAPKDFGPDLSKMFAEMQDPTLGPASAEEIAQWEFEDATEVSGGSAGSASASATLDEEVAAALAQPPVGLAPSPTPVPAPSAPAPSAPATPAPATPAPAPPTSAPPTSAPPTSAPPTSAPAPVRTSARTAAPATAAPAPRAIGVANLSSASQPARERTRKSTSAVQEVFDNLQSIHSTQEPPASPGSRSSESEHSAAPAGPSAFQRRRR